MILDTGCAGTAFPMDTSYGVRTAGKKAVYKTATAELVESTVGVRVQGRCHEHNQKVEVKGNLVPVHKPPLAAVDVAEKDSGIYLWKDAGYIATRVSPVHRELRECFEKNVQRHRARGMIGVAKEENIYNAYMDVSEQSQAAASSPSLGGAGQGARP